MLLDCSTDFQRSEYDNPVHKDGSKVSEEEILAIQEFQGSEEFEKDNLPTNLPKDPLCYRFQMGHSYTIAFPCPFNDAYLSQVTNKQNRRGVTVRYIDTTLEDVSIMCRGWVVGKALENMLEWLDWGARIEITVDEVQRGKTQRDHFGRWAGLTQGAGTWKVLLPSVVSES